MESDVPSPASGGGIMGAVKRKQKRNPDQAVKKTVRRRRDPDETVDLRKLIKEVVPDA
jgi:hypothetical protein